MSRQFKKFIFVVASLILSWLTVSALIWFHFYVLVYPGISFGGEVIFFLPIGFVSIPVYYFLLKKIFRV